MPPNGYSLALGPTAVLGTPTVVSGSTAVMGTQMQPMWSLESETGYHPREVTFAIGQPSKAPQVTPVAHATDAVGMFTMSVVACECCLCLALSRWQTHRARRR